MKRIASKVEQYLNELYEYFISVFLDEIIVRYVGQSFITYDHMSSIMILIFIIIYLRLLSRFLLN